MFKNEFAVARNIYLKKTYEIVAIATCKKILMKISFITYVIRNYKSLLKVYYISILRKSYILISIFFYKNFWMIADDVDRGKNTYYMLRVSNELVWFFNNIMQATAVASTYIAIIILHPRIRS